MIGQGSLIYGESTPFECVGLRLHSEFMLDTSKGIIGLCGSTGSGKSSFLSILAGEHEEGPICVTLDGKHPQPPSIGSVFQQPEDQLFCASVREELLFAPQNFNLEKPDDAYLVSVLKQCGFSDGATFLERDPLQLSGGEKRRVALASVLCMRPKVLLLDEPFAGVDPVTVRILISTLVNLKKSGMGIVYAGHEIFEMSLICEEILCFLGQRVVMRGSPYDVSDWLFEFTGDDIFCGWQKDDKARRVAIGRRACIPQDLI